MGHFLALAIASHHVTKDLGFALLDLFFFFFEYGDLAACVSMHVPEGSIEPPGIGLYE